MATLRLSPPTILLSRLMNKYVLPFITSAASFLALSWGQAAHAEGSAKFTFQCFANSSTTPVNPCTLPTSGSTSLNPVNSGLYNTTQGISGASSQDYAIDLETLTGSIPPPPAANTAAALNQYGTRYHYNHVASSNGVSTTTTSGIFSGAGFFSGNGNIFRLSYGDRSGTPVTSGTATNFTRDLAFSFHNVQGGNPFQLEGSCGLCAQPITLLSNFNGLGSFVGSDASNGTYSYKSNPALIQFSGGDLASLIFEGSVTVENGITVATSGAMTFSHPVPSPLPVVGGGMAFAWSRRLRRRISLAKADC